MLTVQEIQAMRFEKAVFGGYDMKMVDEFVEQVTEDYAAMQKENAALKSKMKVLVDKIEEYKSVEDGMRRALVSAQNIAQETIDKANNEASSIVDAAKTEAASQLEASRSAVALEQEKLVRLRQETSEFLAKMTGCFEKQMHSLVELSAAKELKHEAAQPAPQQTAEPTPPAETVSVPEAPAAPADDITTPAESSYTIPEDIRQFMQQQMDSNNEGMKIKVMEVTLDDKDKKKIQNAEGGSPKNGDGTFHADSTNTHGK